MPTILSARSVPRNTAPRAAPATRPKQISPAARARRTAPTLLRSSAELQKTVCPSAEKDPKRGKPRRRAHDQSSTRAARCPRSRSTRRSRGCGLGSRSRGRLHRHGARVEPGGRRAEHRSESRERVGAHGERDVAVVGVGQRRRPLDAVQRRRRSTSPGHRPETSSLGFRGTSPSVRRTRLRCSSSPRRAGRSSAGTRRSGRRRR